MICPNWEDMPKEAIICTLNWHDVYFQLREKLGKEPTKDMVTHVFFYLEDKLIDAMIESFTDAFDFLLDESLDEVEN